MGTRTGRPRGFDRDAALEQAMLLFWERGYDTVSIRDLTDAMGITPPSLYAAFTDKQTLFEQAVDAYAHRYGSYIREALETEPTAYRAVRSLLTGAAVQNTLPGRPSGCLILNGATNNTVASENVAAGLRARRAETVTQIDRKIRADIEAGELPAETDVPALANFAATLWQGLAQLARDGRDRRDLESVVAVAMAAWPGTRQQLLQQHTRTVWETTRQRLGSPRVEARFLDSVADGAFELITPTPGDLTRMSELVLKYQDFPLGAVDASVVAIAERYGVQRIATTDRRHFSAIRPAHVDVLTLVP